MWRWLTARPEVGSIKSAQCPAAWSREQISLALSMNCRRGRQEREGKGEEEGEGGHTALTMQPAMCTKLCDDIRTCTTSSSLSASTCKLQVVMSFCVCSATVMTERLSTRSPENNRRKPSRRNSGHCDTLSSTLDVSRRNRLPWSPCSCARAHSKCCAKDGCSQHSTQVGRRTTAHLSRLTKGEGGRGLKDTVRGRVSDRRRRTAGHGKLPRQPVDRLCSHGQCPLRRRPSPAVRA